MSVSECLRHGASPFGSKSCIVQNISDHTGPVGWRVGPCLTHNDLHLRAHNGCHGGFFHGENQLTNTLVWRRESKERKLATPALNLTSDKWISREWLRTVQSKVLGETLGSKQLKSLTDEVPKRSNVLVKVARGKALVGTVKEGEEVLLLKGKRGHKKY